MAPLQKKRGVLKSGQMRISGAKFSRFYCLASTIMMGILMLSCVILDSQPRLNHIFSVVISDSATVGTLKEEIQKQTRPAFDHIDADTLDLWNVSILAEGLSDADLPDLLPNGPMLHPLNKLKPLFPDPPQEGHLHIIIRSPHIAGVSLNLFVLFDISCFLQRLPIHNPFWC